MQSHSVNGNDAVVCSIVEVEQLSSFLVHTEGNAVLIQMHDCVFDILFLPRLLRRHVKIDLLSRINRDAGEVLDEEVNQRIIALSMDRDKSQRPGVALSGKT